MTDPFLSKLTHDLRIFVEERDWGQFQSPKNLSMALIVEAAELVEHFQWMEPDASDALTKSKRAAVGEELADILIYTVHLADRLGVNLEEAVPAKLSKNGKKYPAEKARDKIRKK